MASDNFMFILNFIANESVSYTHLIAGLNRIPGVYSPIPMGAFYTVAKLPVDDSDKFCAWCLSLIHI